MLYFWIFIIGTALVTVPVMAWIFHAARDVPDDSEQNPQTRRRLNPDQLRVLGYVLMTLLLLCGAMVELYLFYGRGG